MPLPTTYVAGMKCVLVRLIVTVATVMGFLFGNVAWADRGPVPARLPVAIAGGDADHTVIVRKEITSGRSPDITYKVCWDGRRPTWKYLPIGDA